MKVTKIPKLFSLDGYALPEEFQKYKEQEPEQEKPEEDFGKLLDFEIGRRKHEQKDRGDRDNAGRNRRKH